MKRIAGLLLTSLLLGASRLPATGAEETPQVLGVLEIRGLDALAAAAAELSQAIGSPVPKEMIAMKLYGALGTMPGMGIPPESTVRVVAFRGDAERNRWAALLPVTNDGAEYLDSLLQTGWKKESETAEGILHFVAAESAGLAVREAYFLKAGETLVVAASAEDARRAETLRPTLPPILPAEGDVVLQVRPAALAEAYGAEFGAQLEQTFQAPDAPPEMAQTGRLYAQAYLAAARQIEACVLGLGVADGNLNFHMRVAPASGSAFARWAATVQPPAPAAHVVALPEALAVEVLNLGDVGLLLPAYFGFMEKMLAALPAGAEPAQVQAYLATEKAGYEQFAGDVGFALLPPTAESPVRLAQYAALKDPAVVRGLLPDLVRGTTEMMAAMAAGSAEAMPFAVRMELGEPREFREIAIDRLTYAFQLDGPVAEIWPAALPTKFPVELAWVPGGVLATVGDAALTETLVDRALDGGGAPATARPGWQALYPQPEARLVDLADVALFDVARAYLALIDAADGGQRAQRVPDTAGHFATAGYVFDGLMMRLRFSLADLAAASAKAAEQRARMRAGVETAPAEPEPAAAADIPAEPAADPMAAESAPAATAQE